MNNFRIEKQVCSLDQGEMLDRLFARMDDPPLSVWVRTYNSLIDKWEIVLRSEAETSGNYYLKFYPAFTDGELYRLLPYKSPIEDGCESSYLLVEESWEFGKLIYSARYALVSSTQSPSVLNACAPENMILAQVYADLLIHVIKTKEVALRELRYN